MEQLCAEQARVCAVLARRNAVVCRDRSAALLTVAYAVLGRYRAEKERRGLLDYDDLIDKTLALLGSVDAAWVHYKLDLGIDHMLIDEAQDTSAKQWEIIRRLVAEFTAGKGARELKRTVFAVGDEKQSIFSFQDAAPRGVRADAAAISKRAHEDAGLDFRRPQVRAFVPFRRRACSARSMKCSRQQAIAASVTADATASRRTSRCRTQPPSVVEIWEPMKPDERSEIEGWDAPFDTVSETSPRVKLAQRIARAVRRLVESGAPVGIDGRAARYGDVLVLVRQRGPLFEAIIRALKNEACSRSRAPTAWCSPSISRSWTCMALADALLLPHDDLALAAVLRSPLFGFADEDLFEIACGSRRPRCGQCWRARPPRSGLFAEAAARLDGLREAARRQTPFAFYAALLGAGGGRQAFPGAARRRKRTTRSTNSSTSRSTTSGARRRRCRASSPGCARRAPRSSATWRSRATKCG